ncbi:MAG: small basic family protein [Peptococcaceae bacterium]|nr:small basic family protein [Peptococcaceae bacterium]
MFWLIPVFGLVFGVLIGSIITIEIPLTLAKYLSVAVLAALDSALGGIRCIYEDTFNGMILLTGFISNAILAALLAFLGDQLSVDLYMAAVFVFGIRIFQNLATIRHHILNRFLQKHNVHAAQHKDDTP